MSEATREIPASEAEAIAKRYGYRQVIIMAREFGDKGWEHVTTYGVDKDSSVAAARVGDLLRVIVE